MSLTIRLGGLVGMIFSVSVALGACGGANSSEVLGAAQNDGGSSNGTSGGVGSSGSSGTGGTSGGASSGTSGTDCRCEPPPGPNCTGTGPCGCQPYRCDPNVQECDWSKGANPCGAGRYCKTTNCGRGVCAPVGALEELARAPVCGCDGVTYWNESVAVRTGMSLKSSGACNNTSGNTATCGGLASLRCPAGASCNYLKPNKEACDDTEHAGTCWMLPATCPIPAVGFGPRHRPCAGGACAEECPLIRREQPWVENANCPL